MSRWRPVLLATVMSVVALVAVSCSQPVSRESDLSPNEAPYSLNLEMTGQGRGEVRIVPPDVICRSDCIQTFSAPVSVTLTVTVEAESAIRSWGGACTSAGTTRQCLLRVDRPLAASLELTPAPQPDEENGTPGPDEDPDDGGSDTNEDDGVEEDDDDDERDEKKRDKKGKGNSDSDRGGKQDADEDTGEKNGDEDNEGENSGDEDTANEGNEEDSESLPEQPVDADLTLTVEDGA